MEAIKKKYITDKDNNPIAVQIDIKTYEKIEEILENYALVHLMNEDKSKILQINDAVKYYNNRSKEK